MIRLVLEASTYRGSAALLRDGTLMGDVTVAMRGRDAEALMPAVAALLEEHDVSPGALGQIVCGAGPGAFTSLRIAGAIAKGLALAHGVPLFSISSLALIVAGRQAPVAGRFLAALDAMRGEFYLQPFEASLSGELRPLAEPALATEAGSIDLARDLQAIALGPHCVGAGWSEPHARSAQVITNLTQMLRPADLAGWEPAYGRLAEAQVKWEALHGRPLAGA